LFVLSSVRWVPLILPPLYRFVSCPPQFLFVTQPAAFPAFFHISESPRFSRFLRFSFSTFPEAFHFLLVTFFQTPVIDPSRSDFPFFFTFFSYQSSSPGPVTVVYMRQSHFFLDIFFSFRPLSGKLPFLLLVSVLFPPASLLLPSQHMSLCRAIFVRNHSELPFNPQLFSSFLL